MLFWWFLPVFNTVILIVVIYFVWSRRRLYILANSLPGPPALPIVGNGLRFLGKTEDILTIINNISQSYPKPFRFWLGPVLVIYFSDPNHIEKILSSTKLTHKHDIYEIMKIYLGDGLISSSGYKWKLHRKIIQPMFSLKFVSGYTECFQKHVDICLRHLENHVDGKDFDIHDVIHMCFIDIIGDSVLGTKIDAQSGKNRQYIQASIDMYDVAYERMVKPWLHPDPIYYFTNSFPIQSRLTSVTTQFIKNLIEESHERTKYYNGNERNEDTPLPIIDQMANASDGINNQDFIHHLITLFNASQDTMTIIASFLCLFFGMCPQYQKLAAEEVRTIFGDRPVRVTYDDLSKLSYLDMCVRETLRFIPIGPFILRKTTEDFSIGNKLIPEGCAIAIGIFEVHRSPKHWENPHTFFPDHFLPEAVNKRHPYAFIPFSAGPRNCIGKLMAVIGIKLMMANILQRFEIEADGKISDIKLKSDISVRSKDGYKVRLKTRCWK